jgi:S1-C subfamily serine protease
VADIDGLRALLGAQGIGARVPLSILRGGQSVTLVVEVGERPRPQRRC